MFRFQDLPGYGEDIRVVEHLFVISVPTAEGSICLSKGDSALGMSLLQVLMHDNIQSYQH